MSNTEWKQRIYRDADGEEAETSSQSEPGAEGRELKGLLHSIVDQISDADRRHSDQLRQMQSRLGAMGREAQAIRTRVPDQFAPAFERIETGMAELASRVSGASEARPRPSEQISLASDAAAAPMALRSASDPQSPAIRRREEEFNRIRSAVDTFDVIESRPGSSPWDRDSAEALTDVYERADAGHTAGSLTYERSANEPSTFGSQQTHVTSVQTGAGIDAAWLEARFSDIAQRVEQSLSEHHQDQSFFALGQRLDRFETEFHQALEGIATRGDVEGVRLIEAHISELTGQMETTQRQLERLDTIEQALSAIAERFETTSAHAGDAIYFDVAEGAGTSAVDAQKIAKAAAYEAAARVVELTPAPADGLGDMRGLLERFMMENRQGEENAMALLDTMQQAMIRLLDRVDAIEVAQHQPVWSQSEREKFAREPAPYDLVPHQHLVTDGDSADAADELALDEAIEAIANIKPAPSLGASTAEALSPFAGSLEHPTTAYKPDAVVDAPRSAEKIRQDFIADARRAKMRLATEAAASELAIGKTEPGELTVSPRLAAPVGSGKTASAKRSAKEPAGVSPRVMAGAIITLLAGGLYLVAPFGGGAPHSAMAPVPAAQSAAPAAAGGAGTQRPAGGTESAAPGNLGAGPDAAGTDGGTRGEILPGEFAVGSATVPVSGVALDTERPINVEDLQRIRRHQAMANMSNRLGQAAALGAGQATPAALTDQDIHVIPGASDSMSLTKGGLASTAPLDLPPATVGPLSLRLAAANGDPSAEFEVGARLAEGKGTDQNFKDAAKWYLRAASGGFPQAQYRLGTLYERGLGMKADLARARDWYQRAAEQGNIKAMHNLAVLSANQNKASPDYKTAAQWFGEAAQRGLADSQFNLAVLYENGLGVPQDLKLAYQWLSLAARGGDKEATRRRDILKGKLTVEDLAQAEELVTSFRAKPADPMINDARTAGEAWKKNPANGVSG